MKNRTLDTLQIGDIATIHSRFNVREHRGKKCTLEDIFRRDIYRTILYLVFEDGTKCVCTTEDLSPSRFSAPEP